MLVTLNRDSGNPSAVTWTTPSMPHPAPAAGEMAREWPADAAGRGSNGKCRLGMIPKQGYGQTVFDTKGGCHTVVLTEETG
jgi:hypothetical protein